MVHMSLRRFCVMVSGLRMMVKLMTAITPWPPTGVDACVMVVARNDRAARDVSFRFIDQGLGPLEIVVFDLALGEALVEQCSRGLLYGSKFAGRDQSGKARFLIVSKGNCHNSY